MNTEMESPTKWVFTNPVSILEHIYFTSQKLFTSISHLKCIYFDYCEDEPIVNRDMSVQVQKLSHGGTEFKGYTEHPHRYEEQNGLPFNDYAWKIHLANGGNSQETLAKIEKWDLHNKNGHLVHDFNLERVAEYQQCTGEMLPSKNANECYDYQEKAYCDSSGVDSMSSPGMSASSTAPSPDSADTISQNFARNMAVFKVH